MVEVKADLNDHRIKTGASRPKSSLDGTFSSTNKPRKKKKKKVKKLKHDNMGYSLDGENSNEVEDPYTSVMTHQKNIMTGFENDANSSIGGFMETESQVFKTDTI